ncbi:MAG: PilC/PilY family type IV pilus protein [bacterium]
MKTLKYRIIACLLAIGIIGSSALAKMRPLTEMEDQFVKPNILVILDTSGSMMRDTTGNILSAPDTKGRTHGDHAESRLNIAKGVITNVLDETRDLANFGLMSFKQTHFGLNTNQKGYFPYYKASTDSSTTETIYLPKYKLDQARYTVSGVPNKRANSGPPNFTPVNSFVYNGITYTLKSSNNSKYRRWSVDLKADRYADHNHSGYIATFQDPDPNNPHTFTWKYEGSYYEYTKYGFHTMSQLAHEIDHYNCISGKVVAWVRVPVLNHDKDTIIYIYYGNSSISAPTENSNQVWDENYMAVWHLREKANGSGKEYKDSTSNYNDGRGGGGTPALVPEITSSGKIGYAQDLYGDDYIEFPDSASLKLTDAITLSGWINLRNFGSGDDVDVLIRRRKNIPPDYQLVFDDSYPQFVLNGGDDDPIIGSTYLFPNTWYYIVGTWKSGGSRTVYLNGSSDGTGSFTGPIEIHKGSLYLGGMEEFDSIDGLLDEVRISNVERSTDWIMTEYNNQNSPSTFYSLSSSSPDPGDFERYMKITIDHTKVSGNSDLYNFPVLIIIQDPELSTLGYVNSTNGYDIVFKQDAMDNLYHFDTYYGQEFIADGTEDEGGGASAPVDPNDVFVYYPGKDGIDFNYDSVAGWTDSNYPVGALDKYDPNRGGILLAPFSFSTDQSVQDEKVNEIIQWMEPQNRGGLIAAGYTPTGSTLKNTVSDTNYYDNAYSYFVNEVIPNDPVSCRKNLILFVTDGEPSPISEKTDAVNAASTLYNDKDVTVYMIGFGSDTTGSPTLDSIANAGGCPLKPDGHYAYFTSDQSSLEEAIKQIVLEAAAGDYVTSAPTTGTGANSRMEGNIGLLSSCEFPYWKGHMVATDLLDSTQLWDAGIQLDANHIVYNARKIYTSNLSTCAIVSFFDSGSPNAAALFSLGLGASEKEASDIIEFISGKDRFWRLADITNCTPIVVGTPYVPNERSSTPGHDLFELKYQNRNKVIYTGSNDCMIHCFSMYDGHEVFAYVPPDLFPKLTRIFLNGEHIVTPSKHIYGVAASPKAYDIFHDGVWKTVLVSGEGPGGYNYFALDVTHPSPGDPGYIANTPFSMLWHTGDALHNATYGSIIGESWSTPAFGKITYDDGGSAVSKYLTFLGSGYNDPVSSDVEGTTFMAIKFDTGAENGQIVFSEDIGSASTIVDHALVADAVCYENNGVITDSYIADTSGKIRHIDTSGNPTGWSMNIIYDASVNQPFFYSPAVLQLGSGASAKTLIVAGSGSSDDPDINQSGSTFSTTLYLLLFDSNHFLLHSEVISLIDLVIDPISTNFPLRSRLTCSPVIIKNDISSFYEALFLAYVPPEDNNCDIGKTYLIVYKLGQYENFSLNQKEFIKSLEAGEGKITGIDVTAKSSIVVGVSGHGGGQTSTLTCIPSPPNPVFTQELIQLYWKDHFSSMIEEEENVVQLTSPIEANDQNITLDEIPYR